MRAIPVDTTALGDVLALEVAPKTRRNETTGVDEQKTSTEGQPLWAITALVRAPEAAPELLSVTVPSQTAPQIEPMTPVHFKGLTALPWQMGGRSGVAFSTEAVVPAGRSGKE